MSFYYSAIIIDNICFDIIIEDTKPINIAIIYYTNLEYTTNNEII